MRSARINSEAPRGAAMPNRYTLKAELASGGMGAIYKAFDHLGRREVAYKRLRVPADGGSRAQLTALFQREFDALARLPHPNIVEVYDYGFDAEGPYYTMELLSGADLTKSAPLPYREACRILRDVASALALVHARRLIHRDVSPRNVRLTEDGRAKLIDFGGLMAFGQPEELVGTPAFIAPECLTDAALDQRVDLYALGGVAYWVLTGRVAVRARTLEDLIGAWDEPPVAPSYYAPELPPELDTLVLSLLREDPVARPSSAAYVIDRLTAIAELPPEREERRVAYSYLKQPPLVGREPLLAAAQAAVRGAIAGSGQAMLVEGAPGLGCTTLLDHVELQAQLAGATVLRGEGVAGSAAFALARVLMVQARALYPEIESTLPGMDSVLPAGPERLQPASSPAVIAERRARLLDVVQAGLLQLSQLRPLVVLVDDAELVDAESLALLAALADGLHKRALALVVTTAGGAAADVHAWSKLEAGARCFSLAPLAEREVVQLVEGVFGAVPHCHRLGTWLHAQCGGNPGLCMDIARLLLQRGAIRYTVGTFTLPHDVSEDVGGADRGSALLARIADVKAPARAAADALSLHDGALTAEQIAHVLGAPAHEVLRALEELVERGAVIGAAHGFALASQPLRAALLCVVPAEVARGWHLRLAEALQNDPGLSLEGRFSAGWHLLEAGEHDAASRLLAPLSHDLMQLAGCAARALPVLEAMLAADRKRGRSEEECLVWSVPLVAVAYFGDIDTQRRHLDGTLAALFKSCGLALAARLRPWLGGRLALLIAFVYAALRRAGKPTLRRVGSFRELLTAFVRMVLSGVSASCNLFESARAARLLGLLEPLSSALSSQSGPALIYESCLAGVEVSSGHFRAGGARYARVRALAAKPIRGLDETSRKGLYLGVLNGESNARVADCSPLALELAAQLERETLSFFAPHAECTRMTYHLKRGEIDRAERHRQRAELLALRGGTSWSLNTVLVARWAYGAIQTRDAIRLVQAIAELGRLAALGPSLGVLKQLGEAWLEHLRGQPQRAIVRYEQVIDSPVARQLPTARIDRLLFAAVLNAAGAHARAKALCLELEQDVEGETADNLRTAQLALAEAGLGNPDRAAELLDAMLERLRSGDNPLELGNAHRDRAQVALLAGQRQAFDHHFEAMRAAYRRTENPSLLQQCDALLHEAVRRGLRYAARPSWAEPPAEDELDGTTAVEPVATRTPPKPYTAEG